MHLSSVRHTRDDGLCLQLMRHCAADAVGDILSHIDADAAMIVVGLEAGQSILGIAEGLKIGQ